MQKNLIQNTTCILTGKILKSNISNMKTLWFNKQAMNLPFLEAFLTIVPLSTLTGKLKDLQWRPPVIIKHLHGEDITAQLLSLCLRYQNELLQWVAYTATRLKMYSVTYIKFVIKYQQQLYRMYCLSVWQGYLNIEVKAVILSIQVTICFPRLNPRKKNISLTVWMIIVGTFDSTIS